MERTRNHARTAMLALTEQRLDPLEVARSAIVLGCSFALILAGNPLPL
jgi:hypothetical protein